LYQPFLSNVSPGGAKLTNSLAEGNCKTECLGNSTRLLL
jgi:hypothetical protein